MLSLQEYYGRISKNRRMKEGKNMKRTIQAIITFVLIAGILILWIMGLNVSLDYCASKQIEISIGKHFEVRDIKEIVRQVIGTDEVIIQNVELYEDMVAITAKDLSQEQIEQINQKLNEKYGLENKVEDIIITENAKIRGRDLVKPYILPIGITMGITVVYALIRFRKNKKWKVFFKVVGYPILVEAVFLSLLGITRLPITRFVLPITMALFVVTIFLVFQRLENEKESKDSRERQKVRNK